MDAPEVNATERVMLEHHLNGLHTLAYGPSHQSIFHVGDKTSFRALSTPSVDPRSKGGWTQCFLNSWCAPGGLGKVSCRNLVTRGCIFLVYIYKRESDSLTCPRLTALRQLSGVGPTLLWPTSQHTCHQLPFLKPQNRRLHWRAQVPFPQLGSAVASTTSQAAMGVSHVLDHI